MNAIRQFLILDSHSKGTTRVAASVLAILTLAMFGDTLLSPNNTVLSAEFNDVFDYFIPTLAFGIRELSQGNLPLWNPHVFSGTPFLGTFQSAILYPPNWLHFILPTAKAINVSFAFHTFLMGLFTYLWIAHKTLRPLSCLFGAVTMMFSGAFFLHLQAGHMTLFNAAAWMPLIFIAIDRFMDARHWHWLLVGIFATSMQILAGYPPVVFCTAIAATLYVLLRLPAATHRTTTVLGLGVIAVGSLLLCAMQIGPGLHAAGESLRVGGLTYAFSSSFSLPPESAFTLLAPRFFGDQMHGDYWGRWLFWETTIFVGITGILFAALGLFNAKGGHRTRAILMIAVLVVIALGRYTPVFYWLYRYVPGFDSFRSPSKFVIQATLFAALLAALGVDTLLSKRAHLKTLVIAGFTGAALLGLGGVLMDVLPPTTTIWKEATNEQLMHRFTLAEMEFNKDPFYFPRGIRVSEIAYGPRKEGILEPSTKFAALSLYRAAGTSLALGCVALLSLSLPPAVYVIVLLGMVELFGFARMARPTFDLDNLHHPAIEEYYQTHPGDYRVLEMDYDNHPLLTGAYNIWGYDPVILYRYGEFLAYTQWNKKFRKQDIYAQQDVHFTKYHELFRLLRCSSLVIHSGRRSWVEKGSYAKADLPRLLFVDQWRIMGDPDALFEAMDDDSFDPLELVFLESEPDPEPIESDASRIARLVDSSTDHLTIEADLEDPAILLVTDMYSTGWRIVPIESGQEHYEVIPGDYILRAIPLAAGHHLFRLEYSPLHYRVGRWISLVAFILFIGASTRAITDRIRKARKLSSSPQM